jgi:prepilin-type N-terminal cleavage/methylation domain-containing protein
VNRHGLSIPEVLVAIVILTVGLLGLAASGLHVSDLLAQGSRTGRATTFGVRRLELLRAGTCRATPPADGTEELKAGSAVVAANTWSSSVVGEGQVAIRVVTRYVLSPRRPRTDTLAAVVVCPAH